MEDKINNIYTSHIVRLISLLNQIHDKFLVNFPHITKMIICYLEEYTYDVKEDMSSIKYWYKIIDTLKINNISINNNNNRRESCICCLSKNIIPMVCSFYKMEHNMFSYLFDEVICDYEFNLSYDSYELTYKYYKIPDIMFISKNPQNTSSIISDKQISRYCMLIMSKIIDRLMTGASKSKQTDNMIRLTQFIDDFTKTTMTDKIFKSLFE